MHKLMEIKEMLCEELVKQGERGINPGNLEAIYMMAVAAEKIMKMDVLKNEMEGGYSERRGYSRDGGGSSGGSYSREGGGSYDGGGSYEGGSSYAGRGEHYVRGHYSRDGEMDNMKEKVRRMIEEARNPREKEALQKCLDALN